MGILWRCRIVILAQIITLGAVQPGHSETLRREASYQVAVIPRAPSGVTPADFDSSAAGRRRAGINRDRGRCHGCDLCGLQSRLELRTYFCNGYNSQVHWWRGIAVLKRECQSSGPVILKHDFVHAVIIRQILENVLHLAHNCLEWRAAGRDDHVQPISWKNVTPLPGRKSLHVAYSPDQRMGAASSISASAAFSQSAAVRGLGACTSRTAARTPSSVPCACWKMLWGLFTRATARPKPR